MQQGAFPMKALHLTDSELEAVMAAAKPLAEHARSPFLAAVAEALRELGEEEIGPGLVFRVVASVQRRFWDAPDLSKSKDRSKYR
jgi:hypothetical protein